jgi:hypothetical protein
MNAVALLDQLSIPTPCSENWARMTGDERKRLCTACGKHVYNVSSMTSDEAVALLYTHDGDVCVRFFRRLDGTIVTAGCPSEPLPPPRPWQFHIRTLMVAVAGVASALGILQRPETALPTPPPLVPLVCDKERTQEPFPPPAPQFDPNHGFLIMGMVGISSCPPGNPPVSGAGSASPAETP